jgi:hypothetical protein
LSPLESNRLLPCQSPRSDQQFSRLLLYPSLRSDQQSNRLKHLLHRKMSLGELMKSMSNALLQSLRSFRRYLKLIAIT